MLKNVSSKVHSFWSTTKRLLALLCVWGLVFSLVTIGRMSVAFDYDDTLVFSKPAYERALSEIAQPYSEQYWSVVNRSYDLERPKAVAWGLAWLFRIFGFRVTILTNRPATSGEALQKEWRKLVTRNNFVFTGDKAKTHSYLQGGNYLIYFGDSDMDISEAQKAKVFPIRILRGKNSSSKDDYHPGTLGELVIPFSDY